MNTDEQIRLALRIVFSGLTDIKIRESLEEVRRMLSAIGIFYDLRIDPYPKVLESSMARISFDVSISANGIVEQVVQLLGGSGWHFDGDRNEREAIWAKSDELSIPLCEFVIWVQVQLIPFESLAPSRKLK